MKIWLIYIIVLPFVVMSCNKENQELESKDKADSILVPDTNSMTDSAFISDVGFVRRMPHLGDLDSIIARRLIRVLVPNNLTHYFVDGVHRGALSMNLLMSLRNILTKS